VIILDVNILIYAVNRDAPLHRKAKHWLEATLTGGETFGLSWSVVLAFLRLTTRPGLFSKPLPVATAFEIVESWIEQPAITLVHPGPAHFQTLRDLLLSSGTGGNLTQDAHLAALAIENNATLCSSDADFARFPRVARTNPLTQ